MRCKQVQALLPELLRHELDERTTEILETHLASCEDCGEAYESMSETWDLLDVIPEEAPSAALGERFHAMLDGYREGGMPEPAVTSIHSEERYVRVFRTWIPRLAAATLIAAAAFIMGRETGPKPQIVTLQEEVSQLKDMVAASLVNQYSAGERMQGLSLAHQVENPDEQFLSLLVVTLNNDPNVNVRMAAIDALAHFQENEWVRGELVRSLSTQTSPLIQIPLIELLVSMNEQQAVGVMKAMTENENTRDVVKKAARWGIQQMI